MKRFVVNTNIKWARTFVVMSLVVGMIIGLNPFSLKSASASTEEYKIYSNPVKMVDDVSIVVPVSIHLLRPGNWELTVTVFGESFSRTKTVDVKYSGLRGVAFSNNDFDDIKTNYSIFKKPVEKMIFGKEYNVLCFWRKKGDAKYEYAESTPRNFVMPYPKIDVGNGNAEKRDDGKFCLKGDIKNIMGRGRVDWWFEVVFDENSCNSIYCGMNSVENCNDVKTIMTDYTISRDKAGKQHRYRIVGWDYSRNEKFESIWYFFKL